MKTYNQCTGLPDVERIRRLLNPPWHRRLLASIDPLAAFVWCIGFPSYFAGLIAAAFHRRAILDWFQQLGYWQWIVLLGLLAALTFLGHWIYRKGGSHGSNKAR